MIAKAGLDVNGAKNRCQRKCRPQKPEAHFPDPAIFSLLRVNQIDGMTLITSLRARMGLMAVITGFHGGTIGPGRAPVMFNAAMTIDAKGPFFRVEFMR